MLSISKCARGSAIGKNIQRRLTYHIPVHFFQEHFQVTHEIHFPFHSIVLNDLEITGAKHNRFWGNPLYQLDKVN